MQDRDEKNKFAVSLLNNLVCPNCRQPLDKTNKILFCSVCNIKFPIVNEIPIVLPENSVFSTEQILKSDKTYYSEAIKQVRNASFKRKFRKSLPRITKSWERAKFYDVINYELESVARPRGLQLGAGEIPALIKEKIKNIDWIHSDVDLAFKPDIIADATGLPFPSEYFDIVYADSVLEHVFDLSMAVAEIQRVLKVNGLVAAGIPFLYPFHGIPYDFTRLTPCGLRASFNQTENLFLSRDSGAFVALALQLDARLINLFKNKKLRGGAVIASRFLFSGFKHLDRLYTTTRHLSTTAGLLYVGRKVEQKINSKEIMNELSNLYRDMK